MRASSTRSEVGAAGDLGLPGRDLTALGHGDDVRQAVGTRTVLDATLPSHGDSVL